MPRDFDELWRPAHFRDRGENPRNGLFAGVVLAAFAWHWVVIVWLPRAAAIPANIALAACVVAVARGQGLSWAELGLRRDRLGRGFVVGITAAAAIVAVLALGVGWPATRPIFLSPQIAADALGSRFFTIFVTIPLGVVLLEETLFRGVLLALALRRWSVATAICLVSALFALWHVVPTTGLADDGFGTILSAAAMTFLGGVLFSWLRLRANSVLAPMLAHVATNCFGYLAAVVVLELT